MLTPPKDAQAEVRKAEQGRIGDMNASAFSAISGAFVYTKSLLSRIFDDNRARRAVLYNRIERKIVLDYQALFKIYRKDIVNAYNASYNEELYLISRTLGRVPQLPKYNDISRLPKENAFKITNRILSESSTLRRSKKMAKRVTSIIKDSVKKGRSIQDTTKLLEIEYGFRNRAGKKLTTNERGTLRDGRFAHTNGHFYQFYRIARTETMRMNSIQSNNVYADLRKREPEARLQMVAVIDSRTRQQSIDMNRQVSDAKGTFRYPDGNRYKHGSISVPARWAIQDRETTITVFPELERSDKSDELTFSTLTGFNRSVFTN